MKASNIILPSMITFGLGFTVIGYLGEVLTTNNQKDIEYNAMQGWNLGTIIGVALATAIAACDLAIKKCKKNPDADFDKNLILAPTIALSTIGFSLGSVIAIINEFNSKNSLEVCINGIYFGALIGALMGVSMVGTQLLAKKCNDSNEIPTKKVVSSEIVLFSTAALQITGGLIGLAIDNNHRLSDPNTMVYYELGSFIGNLTGLGCGFILAFVHRLINRHSNTETSPSSTSNETMRLL